MTSTSQKAAIFENRRILAADDDPIMREMMRARLGQEVEVVCAENGEIAWEKLVSEDFDLAIIDLSMPKLDGFGLIQYLRQTPKTVDLPIIVATSRGDNEAIEKAFSSGASGFVTKPINWSLFKYDVQFVLKSGLIERELRTTKQAADVANRTKDNLLGLLVSQLQTNGDCDKSSVQLHNLIEYADLLRASVQLNLQPLNVNTLIDRLGAIAPSADSDKSVKVLCRRILANIEITVDKQLWSAALQRLVTRAIRHAPPGGTVEIVVGGQRDGSLVFSVRDNGPLQSQAALMAEITKFATATPDQLKLCDSGHEFELPIVKRIAELHGGKPLFQSDAANGNIAALWLPGSKVNVLELQETA